jgi:hypothetical protein
MCACTQQHNFVCRKMKYDRNQFLTDIGVNIYTVIIGWIKWIIIGIVIACVVIIFVLGDLRFRWNVEC